MSLLEERLVVIAIAGFVLLNYPLLAVFAVDGTVAGIPILYAYLFTTWLAVIALVGWAHRRNQRGR